MASRISVNWLGGGLILSVLIATTLAFTLTGQSINSLNTTSLGSATTSSGATLSTSSPGSAASSATCVQDAQALETAIGVYESTNSSIPVESGITPGRPSTYPLGTYARKLASFGIANWPSGGSSFALSLSTSVAGDVEVYVPATSTHGVNFETESSSTGCLAL